MNDQISKIGLQSLPIRSPFYPRIGHKAVRFNDQVLVIGGTNSSGQIIRTLLRFNLQNLKIEPILNVVCPSLQGFCAFTDKARVFLWGGNLQNKPCNNLWCFQGSSFNIFSQSGDIPPPRSFHSSISFADKYVLIFGGFNQIQIFNDWYLLNLETFTWSRVQANRQLQKNLKFELVWQMGRGYLISQYEVTRNGCKPQINAKNVVYQVRIISFLSPKIRIDCLQDFQGDFFTPRYNFNLVSLDRQIWVIGGQNKSKNQKNIDPTFFNQVWALNLITLTWKKKNLTLTSKVSSQIIGYENKLFLIGGLKSINEMSTSIDIIHTRNISSLQTNVCNFCKNIFHFDPKNYYKKLNTAFQIQTKQQSQELTQISTNFLSKLARTLQNPIQALGLLIDNCLNMGASSISINIQSVNLSKDYFKQSQSYLFIGDNSKSFNIEEISKIMFSFRFKVQKYYRDHIDKEDIKMRNQYGLHLKLASLRIGNSCLFVTTTIQQSLFVSYFSDCETQCPDGSPSFNCFYYTIDKIGLCSNNLNRQIIRENVKHLILQDQFIKNENYLTKIYIFGLTDIVKNDKQNGKSDIIYAYPQGIGLNSLSNYASYLYLVPFLGREIYIQQNKIRFVNLISKFKEDERTGSIQQIDTSLEKNIFNIISLYRVIKPAEYSYNNVYIFHQNRLISTYTSKQKNLCGVAEIPQLIEVDFFKSKIQKWQEERKLLLFLQSKEQPRKKHRRNQNYLGEDQIRKVKPNYVQF